MLLLVRPCACACFLVCCPLSTAVTFVALGNGAPDLSANIAAISAGEVVLSAGAFTGAAMFVQVRTLGGGSSHWRSHFCTGVHFPRGLTNHQQSNAGRHRHRQRLPSTG